METHKNCFSIQSVVIKNLNLQDLSKIILCHSQSQYNLKLQRKEKKTQIVRNT